MTMEINSIFGDIPSLLLYFVPGYILLIVKSYLRSESKKDKTYTTIMSITISFVLKTILDSIIQFLNYIMGLSFELSQAHESLILLLMSVVASAMWCILVKVEKCKEFINKFTDVNKEFYTNVWECALESPNGAWVNVYLEEEDLVYTGKLINYTIDTDDKNREVLLSCYRKCSIKDGKVIEEAKEEEYTVLIKCNEVKRIELFK